MVNTECYCIFLLNIRCSNRLLKKSALSLRGAFFASLPPHDLSRGGNLGFSSSYELRDCFAPLAKTA